MNGAELAQWINKRGIAALEGLPVAVIVVNARYVFGRFDVQIKSEGVPYGAIWIAGDRFKENKVAVNA